MSNDVETYWSRYLELLQGIEVTTADGGSLDYPAGVEAAFTELSGATKAGGKVIFIGNGGSAAIAGHFSLDYWKAGGMRSVSFNEAPLLTAVANDHGYEEVFAMPIEQFAEAGDALVAISSSGNSANIVRGVEAARRRECRVVGLSGFEPDNRLRALGDVNFYLPASHYGYVEMTHMSILHCILDLACSRKG